MGVSQCWSGRACEVGFRTLVGDAVDYGTFHCGWSSFGLRRLWRELVDGGFEFVVLEVLLVVWVMVEDVEDYRGVEGDFKLASHQTVVRE